MPRDLPLGNGSLLVTFDSRYRLRDLYYPHVGQENHTTGEAFRFGVWADGRFSWIEDEGWTREMGYEPDTLVTRVELSHPELELRLICSEAVDIVLPLYVRRVEIRDLRGAEREVRLFFHHDFHILGNPVGDTAYYEPERRALFHYKADRWFMMNGARPAPPPEEGMAPFELGIDQWATGTKEFRGAEGTWRDAEDGELSGNPIAQGSVDSTLALHARISPNATAVLHYWLAAGTSFEEVTRVNRLVRKRGPEDFLGRTRDYWRLWSEKPHRDLSMLPEEVPPLLRRSLLIIRTQIDDGGGIVAANDSDILGFARDTYSYVWPRDGALVAHALDQADCFELSQRFFEFCRKVITPEGYFLHKHNPDGTLASSWHPWVRSGRKTLPIQEDETGLVVWSLWRHVRKFGDIEFLKPLYREVIARAAGWMAAYRDRESGLPLESYDLWEERYGIHGFTLAATWAGLSAAADLGGRLDERHLSEGWARAAGEIKDATERLLWSPEQGRFARSLYRKPDGSYERDDTLDASLFALWYFGMFPPDHPKVRSTMEAILTGLRVNTQVGGIARYPNDRYQAAGGADVTGNPWFVCTLWTALWHIALASTVEELTPALEIIHWACDRALPSGVLAEQVHPLTGAPLSVSPLTWSHATLVSTVLEYRDKLLELTGRQEAPGERATFARSASESPPGQHGEPAGRAQG